MTLLAVGAAGTAVAQDQIVSDDQPNPDCDAGAATHDDIQDAVDAASPGDTIVVCPGQYNESVVVDKSVRIVADKPEATTDTNRTVLKDVDGTNATGITVQASDVSIEGFNFQNFSTAGISAQVPSTTSTSGLNVNRSAFQDTGTGIVLAADGGTLSNTTLEDIVFPSNERGLRVAAQNGGTVSSVDTNDLLINESSANGVVLAASGGTVTGVTLNGSLVNDTAGTGVVGAATSGGTLSDVNISTVALDNNTDGIRMVSSGAGSQVDSVETNEVLVSNSGQTGVSFIADGAGLSNAAVEEAIINDSGGTGLLVVGTAGGTASNVTVGTADLDNNGNGLILVGDGGTVQNASVNEVIARNQTDAGIGLVAPSAGTVTDVSVSTVVANGSNVGVLLNASNGLVSDVRFEEADIGSTEGNALAGLGIADGGASNYDNVTVTRTLVRNNGHGVLVDGAVDTNLTRSDVNVSYNLIRNNGVGVQNNNSATVFDARLNYWGDSTGPSSATSSDLKDPVFDVFANGNGDSVSEGQNGVSNVRFAPSIGGKRSCDDSQLFDPVPNETVETSLEGETIGGPITDFVGFCLWDRSILPLRSTSASAAQSILNIPTFVDTENGQVPINRQELNVHEKNQQVNVTYEETTGANTSRYANQDAQVLFARVTGPGLDDSASVDDLFSADFNALSGSATFGTSSVEFVAVRNVTLDENGTLQGGAQFTPSNGGTYVAVLTANEVGDGYALTNDGNLTGNVHKNDITAIGFEAIAVRETGSTAEPGNGQLSPNDSAVYTGSKVDFDLDAGFDDSGFTHALVLYNEDNFTDSTLVIDVNGSFDSGNLTLDNGTLQATLTGPDGTTENVTLEVDGPLDGLQNNVTVAGGFTLIDSDATAVTNAERNETVTLNTSGFQSNGTYRFVHVATANDGRFSTDDGTVEIKCQSIPQGVDTDNSGEIDTLEILTAIDTYWRVSEPVPDTCGKTIPTIDQNGKTGILTLIDDFWRPGKEVTY